MLSNFNGFLKLQESIVHSQIYKEKRLSCSKYFPIFCFIYNKIKNEYKFPNKLTKMQLRNLHFFTISIILNECISHKFLMNAYNEKWITNDKTVNYILKVLANKTIFKIEIF